MVNLPIKIAPCPIVEAILEIRFSTLLPEDAIFGVLYNHFKNEYPKFEQLPILQLPSNIRAQDPNLHYSPLYKTQKDNFILQIGPRSVSISNVESYAGWEKFSKKIYETYEHIKDSNVINNIERIGLRYINILEGINIFDNSNFILTLKNNPIKNKTNITTEISYEKGNCRLIASSDTEAQLGKEKRKVLGSIIDIDAFAKVADFKDINQVIEYVHDIEKELFFDILNAEFIKTLNPEY